MREIFITLLIGSLAVAGSADLLQAQAAAEGKVVDAETGKLLDGAHVFLSGTKIGTVTNSSGRYRLRKIPPGAHRLVVSMIGYSRTPEPVVFGPSEIKNIDIELAPVVYEMDEIYVGDLDKRWEKHLKRFTRIFIGESKWADSVKILNPEVLRFEKRWWGRFTAGALAPLQIENRALGYHITYYLDEFSHTGTRTRWDGEPLFTEMVSADSLQAAYWERNRREAFYGSLRHFLLALLSDRMEEEGFILYNLRPDVNGISSNNRHRTSTRRLIREGDEDYLYRFSFSGQLEIVYTQDEEDWRYVRWVPGLHRAPASSQTSYLKLNERPITVDTDGEILEPYGATQSGYFAFSRLADLTPREYRPEGYESSNDE